MSSQSVPLDQLSESEYKRRKRAWAMYDWANSAFATTMMAAVLPVYYSQVAGSTLPSAATATQYWSVTLSLSVLIVAILSPVLGTVSDIMRGKKKFLAASVGVGVLGSGLLVLVNTGDWMLASALFVLGRIGFGAANVFYDALLPHVAKEEDQDQLSTTGYALGYLGGGLLLAVNIGMITYLPDNNWGVRLSFLSVAVWWLLFSIPIFRQVPEPKAATEDLKPGETMLAVSFSRMWTTLRNLRQYRDLLIFLIAFLIYNDGIGVIISVATIYGAELGFASTDLILAILLVQFVGIPYSIVFGNLPSTRGIKQKRSVAFIVFNIIMLPLVALFSRSYLPQTLTGTPSPDFVATDTAVGQGQFDVREAGEFTGVWLDESVSGELRGTGCGWYQFNCDESQYTATYVRSEEVDGRVDFTYNGQAVELVYGTGPESGQWEVLLDGESLLDDDGQPVILDAYSPTIRYDVVQEFVAEDEGEHVLSLVNSGRRAAESAGVALALSEVRILPPLRTSNLLGIMGLLIAVQAVAAVFTYTIGPRLVGPLADLLDTKNSIMLALSAYAIIAVWGYFLNSVVEFWFLAWLVAVVQGGSQALSRSLYATLSPTSQSGEFFGFFSIMSKFASFFSPLVFVLSVAIFDSSRPGVLALVFFFGIGMYLLNKVDVEAGAKFAKERDTQLLADQAVRDAAKNNI